MNLAAALAACRSEQRALLAANFYNAETLLGVVAAARMTGQPVVLQASPSTLRYLGVGLTAAMARAASSEAGVTAWLHLDHASDLETIDACITAGFDSVMLDASEAPFEDNVRLCREAARRSRDAGVTLEAELGYVPKLGQAGASAAEMTRPEDAERFLAETGVDLLAVAIGNAHGFYRGEPRLDTGRLAQIADRVAVPLVLHGGSGLTASQWQDCIRRGVAKINFATEIKDAFVAQARGALTGTDDIDLRRTFAPAIGAVTALVADRIRVCAMEDAR